LIVPIMSTAACLAVAGHVLLSLQPPQVAVSARPVVQTISSQPLSPRDVVHTSQTSVKVISTAEVKSAPVEIADSELLASYHPGGAALVGVSEARQVVEF
jgi:hypothetical protein